MSDAQGQTKPMDLKAWAYEMIKQRIVNLQVQPREQMRIENLAHELNISRTPIREALLQLEKEGLVRVNSRVGFFVRELTRRDLEELFEMRQLTEGYAAQKAAPTLTEEDLAQLDALHRSAATAIENNDQALFNKYEAALHDFLMRHSGNLQLLKMIEGLKDLTARERQYGLGSADNVRCSMREHGEIIDALHRRDGEEAEKMMRRHLGNVRDRLLDMLDLPEDDESPR